MRVREVCLAFAVSLVGGPAGDVLLLRAGQQATAAGPSSQPLGFRQGSFYRAIKRSKGYG